MLTIDTKNNTIPLFLLKLLILSLFLGRAYQALFFDLPLRAFFWDEAWLGSIVSTITGNSWQAYVTNQSIPIDRIINSTSTGIGWIWLITALMIGFAPRNKWTKRCIVLSTIIFILIILLDWKDKFYTLGHLLEHSAQMSLPFWYLYFYRQPSKPSTFAITGLKICIALTFVCHGLYAIGYYPVSGEWISWCLHSLPLDSNQEVLFFLKIMGYLDFLAAFALFFNYTFNIGIWYCIFWGTITALARVVSNFDSEIPLESLHHWGYQMIYRLVHGGMPFLLWLIINKIEND